jgi:hypothetical protein
MSLALGTPAGAARVGVAGSAALEVRGLRVRYGDQVAPDGVDLTVRRGELVAVLRFDPGRRERASRERIGIRTAAGVRVASRRFAREAGGTVGSRAAAAAGA